MMVALPVRVLTKLSGLTGWLKTRKPCRKHRGQGMTMPQNKPVGLDQNHPSVLSPDVKDQRLCPPLVNQARLTLNHSKLTRNESTCQQNNLNLTIVVYLHK
jgi:hypothetical protein